MDLDNTVDWSAHVKMKKKADTIKETLDAYISQSSATAAAVAAGDLKEELLSNKDLLDPLNDNKESIKVSAQHWQRH